MQRHFAVTKAGKCHLILRVLMTMTDQSVLGICELVCASMNDETGVVRPTYCSQLPEPGQLVTCSQE